MLKLKISQPKYRCESYKAGIIWSTGTRRLALYANPIFLNFFAWQKIDIVPTKLQQLLTRIYDHKKERRVLRKNCKEKPIKI